MSRKLDSFLDTLHRAHCDNSRQRYLAQKAGRQAKPIMPLTPFVYEFFLYNSLYQVDWPESVARGQVVSSRRDQSETQQQRCLWSFIREDVRKNPAHLFRAFEPLLHLGPIEGKWCEVAGDGRICREDGRRFFESVRTLQRELRACNAPESMPTNKKTLDLVEKARFFIYQVRNNVFHGSKSLGVTYEKNQKRRIEVYELILKGITSLFFLAMDRQPVATDLVPCPVFGEVVDGVPGGELLDQDEVWSALMSGAMKEGDSRLIYSFKREFGGSDQPPDARAALFSPSSGGDLLTPILLGLPYCSQFYFFEISESRQPPLIAKFLRRVPGLGISPDSRRTQWAGDGNRDSLEFEYQGVVRKVFWVHEDNARFLDIDVDLAFYFHRGDSPGESGSGQKWDSDRLPDLQQKVAAGSPCVFLTDGEPGGLDERLVTNLRRLSVPFIERSRSYFAGYLGAR